MSSRVCNFPQLSKVVSQGPKQTECVCNHRPRRREISENVPAQGVRVRVVRVVVDVVAEAYEDYFRTLRRCRGEPLSTVQELGGWRLELRRGQDKTGEMNVETTNRTRPDRTKSAAAPPEGKSELKAIIEEEKLERERKREREREVVCKEVIVVVSWGCRAWR